MIINAKIDDIEIMIEDHGILTAMIYITSSEGWSCGIGGYAFDYTARKEDSEYRKGCPYMAGVIRGIMEVVGVRNWSDLKGKYIRIDDKDQKGPISIIGNIIEDKWFDIRTYIEEYEV